MESFFIIDDNVNTLNVFEVNLIMANFKTNICVANDNKEIILRNIEKLKIDYLLVNLSIKKINSFFLLEYLFDKGVNFKEIFVYADEINEELINWCDMYNVKNFFDKNAGENIISEKIIKIIKNKNKI